MCGGGGSGRRVGRRAVDVVVKLGHDANSGRPVHVVAHQVSNRVVEKP